MSDFDLDIAQIMEELLVLMGETSQEKVAAKGAEEVKGDDTEVDEFRASWFEVEAGLSSLAQLAKVRVMIRKWVNSRRV